MPARDNVAGPYWLDSDAVQRASDIALGAVLAGVATLAIANVSGSPFGHWDRLNEWFLPATVAGLVVIVGIVLLIRGILFGHRRLAPWSFKGILNVVSIIGAALLAARHWGRDAALLFGPSEIATLVVLGLALAVALARMSRVRTAGMMLLGLLLSTVGTDLSTGNARLTMGLAELADGISIVVVALGLIIIAESATCLVSPRFFLEANARQVAGWVTPPTTPGARSGMRILAAFAAAEACFYAYRLNASTWNVGELLLFGVFGIACRILGWSRLALILALAYGPLLKENIRRAMLISRGDPATFVRWPYSGAFLLLACGVLVAAILLPAWRNRFASRNAS